MGCDFAKDEVANKNTSLKNPEKPIEPSNSKPTDFTQTINAHDSRQKTSPSTDKASITSDHTTGSQVFLELFKKEHETYEFFKPLFQKKDRKRNYLVDTIWMESWLNFVINK